MKLSTTLRDKIRLRAAKAWAGEEVHRITEVSEKTLYYRLSGKLFGTGLYGGKKIRIWRDKIGRIYVPKSVDA